MFSVEQLVANRIWFDLRSRVIFCKPHRPAGRKLPLNRVWDNAYQLLGTRWQVKRGRDITLSEAAMAIAVCPVAYFFHVRSPSWLQDAGMTPADWNLLSSIFPASSGQASSSDDSLAITSWDDYPVCVTWSHVATLSRWSLTVPLRPSDSQNIPLAYALRRYVEVLCTPIRLRETESWGEVLE